MHEIVTLQFGQQANYVGTHYWNTQESYFTYSGEDESPVDHDISFRPGIGADGADTYTPRTLIYDLKSAFGTLRRENALYELQNEEAQNPTGPWSTGATHLRLPTITPSPYQQALDSGQPPPQLTTETVRFWSDFNHVFYHPRSIVQLHDYEVQSSLLPFEQWQTGVDLFNDLDREHDLLDRDLRPFLEECDQLQAIQILTGVDDAWGGFAAKYLERIADDLGKGCRWLWGLEDHQPGVSRQKRALMAGNVAQSLYATRETASMYIPLTSAPTDLPDYLRMDTSSKWHTSALQAMTMESATLPSRLRTTDPSHATLDHLELALSHTGNRRIASASLSAADPATQTTTNGTAPNGAISDARMTNGTSSPGPEDKELDISLSPSIQAPIPRGQRRRKNHIFSSAQTLRGQWIQQSDLQQTNRRARDPYAEGTKVHLSQSRLLFPILPSYPPIFSFPNARGIQKVAVKAALSTDSRVAERLRWLKEVSGRGLGFGGGEEREALGEGLEEMAGEYEEGWSESESEGEEDQ